MKYLEYFSELFKSLKCHQCHSFKWKIYRCNQCGEFFCANCWNMHKPVHRLDEASNIERGISSEIPMKKDLSKFKFTKPPDPSQPPSYIFSDEYWILWILSEESEGCATFGMLREKTEWETYRLRKVINSLKEEGDITRGLDGIMISLEGQRKIDRLLKTVYEKETKGARSYTITHTNHGGAKIQFGRNVPTPKERKQKELEKDWRD